jgi:tripartite-type tricarboxylate transporter receptor subunit TctC
MRRPISLVFGAGSGGVAGTVTGPVVAPFSMILNTRVLIANHTGAGGTAGTASVARAPAYTTRMLKSLQRVSNTPIISPVTVLKVTTNIVAR